ncbi:cobyrinic acid ac-diamide synthase [Candidatus Vecturithrix granuli]|uniref:Cobyrinic acid ac-diamide synthase n=1 Tax=Vecturithrix granuli TaxID=1499967 RepID=A0A0S6W649_VECG1|nr:cobyrinic acid ac-diamide synthase [Candidatus Vecturithrix granuli]
MSKIISIHSFRGGTGKSNTTANLSLLLADQGLRVGIVDTDIQSPGIHVLLGLDPNDMVHTLNDYLWGKCELAEAAHDMSSHLGLKSGGQIFLIPSSMKANDIARILKEGYDVGLLNDGFNNVLDDLELDVLMIDTHPGLNEETLLSIAISDALVLIMRPDQQDIQGTAVTIDVARKLSVPNLLLVVNKAPDVYDFDQLKRDMEKVYDCPVAAILPHSDEMMVLGGKGVFSLSFPDHPVTLKLKQVAAQLMA